MLALAQATREALAKRAEVARWQVSYRRRFWNIEAQRFDLEAAYTVLPRADVRSVSPSRDSLDRAGINEFKSANVTLEIANRVNEWSERNPNGKFAPDAAARMGYVQQLMEFKVEIFVEHADGSESAAIPTFVGRAVSWDFYPRRRVVQVTVESRQVQLRTADAEKVSLIAANETLTGLVNGVNKDFTTANTGVGRVTELRLSGVVKKAGVDYTVEDLNDPAKPALVRFTVAPPVASQTQADYFRWKQDQKIESLVADLCEEAGILAADRLVDPVIFPNQVLNKRTFTSQADWDAGVKSNVETAPQPGDVILQGLSVFDDFNDGSFSDGTPRTWTETIATWLVAGGGIQNQGSGVIATYRIETPSAQAAGTWEWSQLVLDAGASLITVFMAGQSTSPFNGYAIDRFTVGNGGIRLLRLDSGGSTTLASFIDGATTPDETIRVTRDGAGQFKIYRNGVLLFTITDTTFNISAKLVLQVDGLGKVGRWDNFKFTPDQVLAPPASFAASGSITTPATDTLPGNPKSWGLLERVEALAAGTSILHETAVSADNVTYDPFVAVAASGQIQSALKRFVKVRATLNSNASQLATPVVSEIGINWASSTTSIRLANFTGMTCLDAVRTLASIAGYEFGFNRDGKFFFRQRAADANVDHVVTLANLREANRISDGVDRVFNLIRAAYGNFEKFADPATQGDSRPHSSDRYGKRQLSVGSTQLLLNPDTDVATGLAATYFNLFKDAMRVFEVEVDLAPQLELGDTVLLQVADLAPSGRWHVGDTARRLGDESIHLWGHEQQSAFDVLGRVVSVAHDLRQLRTRLELEEIT